MTSDRLVEIAEANRVLRDDFDCLLEGASDLSDRARRVDIASVALAILAEIDANNREFREMFGSENDHDLATKRLRKMLGSHQRKWERGE